MLCCHCKAPNAYNATSAIAAVLASPLRLGLHETPRVAKRASNRAVAASTRRFATGSRLYSTGFQDDVAAHADGVVQRAHEKLHMYDAIMNPSASRRENREAEELQSLPEGERDSVSAEDWKPPIFALSEHVRKMKKLGRGKAAKTENDSSAETPEFNYKGLVVRPRESPYETATAVPWSISEGRPVRTHLTAAEILDQEINRFAEHVALTPTESQIRKRLVRLIISTVRYVWPNKKAFIYAYGSTKTGLAMPYSDIDIGIDDPSLKDEDTTVTQLQERMQALYDKLRSSKDYICVVYRPEPVPIITVQHRVTGIDLQIIGSGRQGAQEHIVGKYLDAIPNMRALYAVFRTMFGMRGFVDPYIGGISAYGTFMMLAAALNREGVPPEVHHSPSSQLLCILDFWSNFNSNVSGISIADPKGKCYYFKKFHSQPPLSSSSRSQQTGLKPGVVRKRVVAGQLRIGRHRENQPYLLCLQDKANPNNDLGSSCNAIKHILETIKHEHRNLKSAMERHDALAEDGQVLSGDASFLLPLVGRCHEVYAEQRERIASQADQLPIITMQKEPNDQDAEGLM